MHQCVICRLLGLEPRYTTNVVGLVATDGVLPSHFTHPAGSPARDHVMVPACPEHVVDVYRGRVPGVAMAWRLPELAPAD